jgi:hypothetical protein
MYVPIFPKIFPHLKRVIPCGEMVPA